MVNHGQKRQTVNKIRTHKRFKRALFIRTRQNQQIFRATPLSSYKMTRNSWKLRNYEKWNVRLSLNDVSILGWAVLFSCPVPGIVEGWQVRRTLLMNPQLQRLPRMPCQLCGWLQIAFPDQHGYFCSTVNEETEEAWNEAGWNSHNTHDFQLDK